MKIVKKRESINAPVFGDLLYGDLFFSPAAECPDEVYMVIDNGSFSNEAVNLFSGCIETFGENDAVVKVEGTLTLE